MAIVGEASRRIVGQWRFAPDGPDDLQENSKNDSVSKETKRNDDIQAQADIYCQKLLKAIERGELIAVYTKKNFDSNLVLKKNIYWLQWSYNVVTG